MRIIAILLGMTFAGYCFAAPTTQPANTPHPQIAVFSFTGLGQSNQDWIGQAIEENFIAELSRGQAVWPVRAIADSNDPNGALKTARVSGATYLLTGAYQVVGDQLRATGQIIAARDGHVVGGLTATGAIRDLFAIEDTLAMEAKRLLAPPSSAPVVIGQPIASNGPLMAPQPLVSNDFSASAYQPAPAYGPQYDQYVYYSMPYSYSGYGGSYLGYGIGIGGFGYGGYGYFGGGYGRGFIGSDGFRGGFGHITWGGAGGGHHSLPW